VQVAEADERYLRAVERLEVKSRSFCNFLQGRFPFYRSMRITPSDARSS
jgi:hypothetical protein